MPGYKGHTIGGLVTFIILSLLLKPPLSFAGTIELALMTCIGALFPDVDIKSRGQRYFYIALAALLIFLGLKRRFVLIFFVSLIGMVPLLVHHRGPFHNPKFLIMLVLFIMVSLHLMQIIGMQKLYWHAVFFLSGALSHLVLDFGCSKFIKKLLQ